MTTAQEIKRIREHRHRRANQKTAAPQDTSSTSNEEMVWITAIGSKYHNKNNCGQTDPSLAGQRRKVGGMRLVRSVLDRYFSFLKNTE